MRGLYLHPERDKAASVVASALLAIGPVQAVHLAPIPTESNSFSGDYRIVAIVDPHLAGVFNRICEHPWSQYAGEGEGRTTFNELPAARQEIALTLLDISGLHQLLETLRDSADAIDLLKDGWAEIVLAAANWRRNCVALSALQRHWNGEPPTPVYDPRDWPYGARFHRVFSADLVTFDPR